MEAPAQKLGWRLALPGAAEGRSPARGWSATEVRSDRTPEPAQTKAREGSLPPGPCQAVPYSALTLIVLFRFLSTMWIAQARHGSKECTVRSTSSGFSGSAIGVPTSAAS